MKLAGGMGGWVGAKSWGDVSSRGHGDKGDVGRQGEGGYPKKWKIGETSFMDGPLWGVATNREQPLMAWVRYLDNIFYIFQNLTLHLTMFSHRIIAKNNNNFLTNIITMATWCFEIMVQYSSYTSRKRMA